MKRARLAIAAAAVVVAALVVGVSVWGTRASGGPGYSDPRSYASIRLFDAAGRPVTSGSIDAHPFVARAESTRPVPAAFHVTGCKATLLAYQPREGAPADAWSGDTLTGSMPVADLDHPAATATAQDFSLRDFLGEFPARWGGRVQLRIYFGAPGLGTLTTTYASLDITVTGDRWSAAEPA